MACLFECGVSILWLLSRFLQDLKDFRRIHFPTSNVSCMFTAAPQHDVTNALNCILWQPKRILCGRELRICPDPVYRELRIGLAATKSPWGEQQVPNYAAGLVKTSPCIIFGVSTLSDPMSTSRFAVHRHSASSSGAIHQGCMSVTGDSVIRPNSKSKMTHEQNTPPPFFI